MTHAVETRGERQLVAAERMLRKFMWVGASIALACSDATGTIDSDVALVAVTPPASTITVGAELPLQAVVQDATGRTITGASVFWSVRDPSIASVSSSGVVTGLAVGATQVSASAGGKSAVSAITVQRVPVASVVVRPTNAAVATGDRVQFTATVHDANQIALTDRSITWSSSNEAVATVSSTGMATGVSPGVATITATSEVRSDAATITVTLVPVTMVEVTPNPLVMSVGQAAQLTATPRDAGGVALTGRTATWSSSNTNVVTVSGQGVVNAFAAGTATVTATIEGKSATASVTVTPVPVATVTVVPSTATVFVQNTVTLSATTSDVSGNTLTGRTVTWTTNASAVATVSSSGVVTGVAPGTATITATSEGKSGTATVTVTLAAVATVTVEPSTATIASGSTTTLTANVTDQNGGVLTDRVVTWSSSNPSVATVSSTGVVTGGVTGALVGTATITASTEGKSGSASVTVIAGPVASVRVTPTSTTVERGTTVHLTAQALDAAGNPISGVSFSWASSDPSIASVNGAGQVNTKKEGTVTITATTAGISGSATVTVTK
ncbi:MAG TPA: Ig-like domain-containing protein [Gemmatimonadaceae bacterium]|nr:Ig-like domain-containing protein [Gemmatimonadaceae bacterium]